MKKTVLITAALISASAMAQDVRVFPPGPARAWGQKMPEHCTPVTTWPTAYYPATYPVAHYQKDCAGPWFLNFIRFWNWTQRPEPAPK